MCDLCVTFVQHFIGVLRVLDIMFCQIKSKNSSVYKPGIFSLARLKLLEKNNVFWREDVFWTKGPEWPPYVFGVFSEMMSMTNRLGKKEGPPSSTV